MNPFKAPEVPPFKDENFCRLYSELLSKYNSLQHQHSLLQTESSMLKYLLQCQAPGTWRPYDVVFKLADFFQCMPVSNGRFATKRGYLTAEQVLRVVLSILQKNQE